MADITYQDAITAMETCGVWISSERTELAGIYTEIGGSFTSNAWGCVRNSIWAAASMIAEVSETQYGKTPSELTDEEIMGIRTEISEELWLQIFEAATSIASSLVKTIEAVWNVAENQYSFALVQTDVMDSAFVTYVGRAGMPKIFPSRVSAYYTEVDVAVVLKDSEIPEVSAGGVLYGWYSSNDTSGAMLKAGDILPLPESSSRYIGTVYAGIVREEVSVQMRTKQLINGAIQEFVVYPKTQSGGDGSDVVKIVYDDTTMSAEDLGVAVKAVCDAGKIPAVVWGGGVFYCQLVNTVHEGHFWYRFAVWGFEIDDEALTMLKVATLHLEYVEGTGWSLLDSCQEIPLGGE